MRALTTGGWVDAREQANDVAFNRLFTAEYQRVVGIANRILADCHEAEDVAQEVFSSFHRGHPADAPYAAAWIYAAAAHTALNVIRGRRRRATRERADAEAGRRIVEAREDSLDPQHAVERAEARESVRRALGRLAPKSAAALALRYSGLSYAEVAAALKMRADQVGTLLRRSEAALRKEMRDETSR